MAAAAHKPAKIDATTTVSCIIGAGIWWFLASEPSTTMMLIAAMVVWYLFLVYCLMAIYLPEPGQDRPAAPHVDTPVEDTEKAIATVWR